MLLFAFFSCDLKNDIDVDDRSEEIQSEYPWLKELIQKAETDKTGNYVGFIWLEQYEGKDYFVTNMMLGSGGIAYWIFDTSGKHFAHNETEFCSACEFVENGHFHTEDSDFSLLNDLKKDIVIYAPVSFRGY